MCTILTNSPDDAKKEIFVDLNKAVRDKSVEKNFAF